ncbi:MAG TPA: hypothetical protein VGE00_05165, partial [Gammaproteobacteria bacterium]
MWWISAVFACCVPLPASSEELPPLAASDTSITSPAMTTSLPRGEPLILEVTFNQVSRGAVAMIITETGDYLLRGEDLAVIGVVPSPASQVEWAGERFYSLRLMGASHLSLDEARLALSAELPGESWPKQRLDLQTPPAQPVIRPHNKSALFNYRLLNSGYEGGEASWLLGGELGIRYQELLFRSEHARLHAEDVVQVVRYGSSITYDDRSTLQRTIAGDFVTSSGNLGSTLSLGGLSFTKAYAIDPYFVRQPTAGFVTTLTAPAEVGLYLDGTRLRTTSLQPGEFELKNFNYYGGQHDLELVIRDSFGREERLAYPYYFSEQNLRQGLHDYSYNAGRIRSGAGTREDSYGEWGFSAYHR